MVETVALLQAMIILMELGVVKKAGDGLKVLGSGELTRKITVEAHQFSKSAVEKIQSAGGAAQVIGGADAQ
jgi:large subunit ribosomal protein L15